MVLVGRFQLGGFCEFPSPPRPCGRQGTVPGPGRGQEGAEH